MLAIAVFSLLLQSGQPAHEEAVRCAGLSQAASEIEGGESARGKTLFDAALYWSLTALQSARASGISETAAQAEQDRARIEAVRALAVADGAAQAELERCIALAPRLG